MRQFDFYPAPNPMGPSVSVFADEVQEDDLSWNLYLDGKYIACVWKSSVERYVEAGSIEVGPAEVIALEEAQREREDQQ